MSTAEQRSLSSYAAACLSIYLRVLDRGTRHPFRDVNCVLCEDGKTVMLEVAAGDRWISACFELAEKVSEDVFDPRPYVEGFIADV